jgi:hypothetical protein
MIVNFGKLGTFDPEDDNDTKSPINAINDTLGLLRARALLYMEMIIDGKAEVRGTLHCEASLASLLALSQGAVDGKYDTLIWDLQVTYTIVFQLLDADTYEYRTMDESSESRNGAVQCATS